MRVPMRISSTLSRRSSSSSSRASCSSSSDMDRLYDLVRVDLAKGCAALVAVDLTLGCIGARDEDEGCGPELLRDRLDPDRELLEPLPGRQHAPRVEVDHIAGEPVADRAPEVLLDEAMRMEGKLLAVVERAGDAGDERVHEGREGLGGAELGLTVADPELDRREGEVRPDAPPDLRVLDDRAGVVEETHVALVLVPGSVRVRNAATGKHTREDLRPRRMQVRVAPFAERRA